MSYDPVYDQPGKAMFQGQIQRGVERTDTQGQSFDKELYDAKLRSMSQLGLSKGQARDRSRVEASLERIHALISALEVKVEVLSDRLKPVSSPSPQSTKDAQGAEIISCALEGQINAGANRIAELENKISGMISDLCI